MDWFSRNKIVLTGVGLSLFSVVVHFLAVNQSGHPSGWDGYYYVMQVHSWINYGHLQSPDASLIYPFLAVITLITGDPILGFKVGVAIISGLLVGCTYFYLVRRDTKFIVTCLACSYLIFSPLTTYFLLQFPKNALGMVFLIFLVDTLINLSVSATTSGSQKTPLRRYILPVVLLIATVMTHRMTGVFAVISILIVGFRAVPAKWIVGTLLLLLGLSLLPGTLHVSDLARFNNQFATIPHFAPTVFAKIFQGSLDRLFKFDLLILIVMILIVVYQFVRLRFNVSTIVWIWLSIAFMTVFPFFEFHAGTIGYRLFMIAPIALVFLSTALLRDQEHLSTDVSSSFGLYVTRSFCSVLFIASLFSFRSYQPNSFDPPNNLYVSITNSVVKQFDAKKYPLVIAHKSLAEVIIYKTDFDALNWLPPDDVPTEDVLRITSDIPYSDFRNYLNDEDLALVQSIARGYFALPEMVWQKFVSRATEKNDKQCLSRIFSGQNPMEAMPYFINKGKSR